jgi:hypothetical protein
MTSQVYCLGDGSPLVQYEITFPKKTLLLGAGEADSAGAAAGGDAHLGVAESLVDDIKWEPHVDEADKLDYIVAVSSQSKNIEWRVRHQSRFPCSSTTFSRTIRRTILSEPWFADANRAMPPPGSRCPSASPAPAPFRSTSSTVLLSTV